MWLFDKVGGLSSKAQKQTHRKPKTMSPLWIFLCWQLRAEFTFPFWKHSDIEYKCDQCDAKARTRRMMKFHEQKVHDGLRYYCKLCSHQATTAYNLKTHKQRTHDQIEFKCTFCDFKDSEKSRALLAPQSGAHRISAYRDFLPSHPIPLIAFEHISLSMVIWDIASRLRQINVEQVRPKQVSILRNFQKIPNFPKFS